MNNFKALKVNLLSHSMFKKVFRRNFTQCYSYSLKGNFAYSNTFTTRLEMLRHAFTPPHIFLPSDIHPHFYIVPEQIMLQR